MDNKLNLVVNFLGIDKLSGAMKNIIGAGKSGAQALKGMKDEARKLERELSSVRKEIANGSGNLTGLINKERELARATAAANMDLRMQQQRLARIGQINATANAMARRGQALQSAGTANMTGGTAAGIGILGIAKQASDFDGRMTDIGIKLRINDKLTASLGNKIFSAAAASNQLPSNLQGAADVLASAGIEASRLPAMLIDIGKVGVAANADVSDLAATSASNMQNLGIAAKDTGMALGIMAAAGKAGKFELKSMAQYFPALAARAKAFGQQGPRAVADLAAGAQIAAQAVGGDGSQAAINLENLLAKINTEETRKKFTKMGVDLPAAMKKAYAEGKTPLEAIAELTKKTLGESTDNLSMLFGDMQAQNALLPLMQNMEEFRRIRQEALDKAPEVMIDFARKSKDSKVQLQALLGAGQASAVMLGREMMPALLDVGQGIIGMVRGVTQWMRAHPQLTSAIAQGVVYLTAFRIGLGATQWLFGGILGPMSKLYKGIMLFKNWGGVTRIVMGTVLRFQQMGPALFRAFSLMRTGALLFGSGMAKAGALMLANPMILGITLLVAALAVAGYMIYTHWATIKSAFFGAIAWLQALPSKMMSIGKSIISGLVSGIIGSGARVGAALYNIVLSGVNKVKSFLDINSPSKLFMGIGLSTGEGMALGIDKGRGNAIRAAGRLASGVTAAGALSLAPATAGTLQRSPQGQNAGAESGAVYNISITINAGGNADATSIADQVMRQLEQVAGIKARSTYSDDA